MGNHHQSPAPLPRLLAHFPFWGRAPFPFRVPALFPFGRAISAPTQYALSLPGTHLLSTFSPPPGTRFFSPLGTRPFYFFPFGTVNFPLRARVFPSGHVPFIRDFPLRARASFILFFPFLGPHFFPFGCAPSSGYPRFGLPGTLPSGFFHSSFAWVYL